MIVFRKRKTTLFFDVIVRSDSVSQKNIVDKYLIFEIKTKHICSLEINIKVLVSHESEEKRKPCANISNI
jgi:hypothetical protein